MYFWSQINYTVDSRWHWALKLDTPTPCIFPLIIYIYIYIFFKEKIKDRLFWDYKFISILFCVSDVNQKHEEKYNI